MNCKICNSTDIHIKYSRVEGYKTKKNFSIKECQNCQVCFTYPFLSAAEYRDYHNSHQVAFNGAGDDEVIKRYLKDKETTWNSFNYQDRLNKITLYRPGAKKILDIGCGAGLYVDYLKNKGYSAEGIELSPWGYNIATKKLGLKVQKGLIEKLQPPKVKFDVITLYDVIEHTTDPNKFLQELKKWLKKDGVLIINVPNLDSVIAKSSKHYWNKLSPPDHTFHFTPKSISYLLNKNGYNPIEISTNHGDPGESLGQLMVGFWVYLSKHFNFIAKSIKYINQPYVKKRLLLY